MIRAVHVVPSISEEATGPAYSVPRLCESLIEAGMEVRLATLDWPPVPVRPPYLLMFPFGRGPQRLGRSPEMLRWLREEVTSGRTQIVHSHSLWMMPNVYPGLVCGNGRSKLVISPRGTLSEQALSRNALQKKCFWLWPQGPSVRAATCLHATAESEYLDIRRLGLRQPVCVLPNGIDIPVLEQLAPGGRHQLLYLGRIHPMKGIDTLLCAWESVEGRFPDWELQIVGPDNGGYVDELKALAVRLDLKRVNFRGPLYGQAKLRAYRDASLFVLPSHSENFGMAVAEALAAGTPAIVSKGAPWAGLAENDAGWWIEDDVSALASCLEESLSLSNSRLQEMGRAGSEWMKRDFSWRTLGSQWLLTYRWILEGGEAPPWVRLA